VVGDCRSKDLKGATRRAALRGREGYTWTMLVGEQIQGKDTVCQGAFGESGLSTIHSPDGEEI